MYVLVDIGVLETAFGFDLFIILFDMGWRGDVGERIRENLDDLARRIELHGGAMVRCLGEQSLNELSMVYLEKNIREFMGIMPFLLITDKRPNEVDNSTLRIFIPLKGISDNSGGLDSFLSELVQFVRERDVSFLNRFEEKNIAFGKC